MKPKFSLPVMFLFRRIGVKIDQAHQSVSNSFISGVVFISFGKVVNCLSSHRIFNVMRSAKHVS